ncbi:MAG: hypothetical protein BJ554DRAFT_4834 [Olpidium bornovanus]|uniref:Uncharacterized protein n=1 Tax=Olpidium bornovanus TaxID=278681 RepID=A0A8H7ZM83_9FUNG|nr:MAG: hypothetical protein BJ554DRAFT_4834 [Olpidium bornovanus]
MVATSTRIVLGDATPGSEVLWRDFETWEPVFGDVRDLIAESQGRVELAISGNAFRELLRTGIIRDILLGTRRMAPDDKVTSVKLHMERGVTAMCGDGGNDCGALRAAHVGIALSEAEASIVSPFSTSNRSIFSCVELLKQGRAALATSFAGYKYLMMYGATMAWLELVQYYFSVIASQWLWIMYDGFVTVGLSFALTLAKPAPNLARLRPTARLLGPQTLASAIGPIFINLAFFVGAVAMLFRESFFKCREFDAASINTAYWWLLGDNFEAEVIGLVALFQFINSSIPFSFGYRFRAAFYRNWVHLAMYTGMMGFASFLVLAGPNRLSCVFRVNCGSAKYLEANGYGGGWDEAVNGVYNNPWEHNIMPVNFRIKLFVYILANCAANILYERFVVLGRFFGCFSPK